MSGAHLLWSPLLLGCGAVLIHLVSRFFRRDNRLLAMLAAMAYAAALVTLARAARLGISASVPPNSTTGDALLQAEPGGILIGATSLILGVTVAVYSATYLEHDHRYEYYYPLLLFMSAGMVGALLAADLFVVYLFTVLSSVSAYALVAFRRHTDAAVEAGFKYAVMGSLGSALVLFGVGFVYRDTGGLHLAQVADAVRGPGAIGPALIVAGYAVKAALVPAHTWLPDAHGRAPSSVSALLSGIYIQVNLYLMVRLGLALGWSPRGFGALLVALASLNMCVGNVMALRQQYSKRLLGYSSVAQVGYMLLAFGLALISGSQALLVAGLFLVVAHAWMKGLAFLVKGILHHYYDAIRLDDLNGIFARMPLAAGLFSLALAGLAGVPPLVGFLGKWQLVVGALQALVGRDGVLVSAALAVFIVNTLVGLGYYLPLVGRLYAGHRAHSIGDPGVMSISRWMTVPTLLLGALIVVCGVWPRPILELAQRAADQLLGGL